MSDQTPKDWRILRERHWDKHDQNLIVRPFVDALVAEVTTLTARCEALEQENAKLKESAVLVAELHNPALLAEMDQAIRIQQLEIRCEALTAERDTLRQKLSGADEIRVSFAAGYTAALDDALKGTR